MKATPPPGFKVLKRKSYANAGDLFLGSKGWTEIVPTIRAPGLFAEKMPIARRIKNAKNDKR